MSIQWTLIAGVMYVELGVTILMLLPIISPQRWHSVFKSRFLRSIANMAHIYFKVFLGILALFFIDAIREMRKYNSEIYEKEKSDHTYHLDSDMQAHMRLFRAQRNFYISGFSLFLWVVLQRLATLLSRLAVSQAECSAALSQAKNASDTAAHLISAEKKEKVKEAAEGGRVPTDEEHGKLKEECKHLKAEYQAALKQAEAVTKEYDRLLEEHSKLQEEVKVLSGVKEAKKEN